MTKALKTTTGTQLTSSNTPSYLDTILETVKADVGVTVSRDEAAAHITKLVVVKVMGELHDATNQFGSATQYNHYGPDHLTMLRNKVRRLACAAIELIDKLEAQEVLAKVADTVTNDLMEDPHEPETF